MLCRRHILKQLRRGNRYSAVVGLNVKNAFSSASWVADSLHRLRVSEYLCQILKSCIQDCTLSYETDSGKKSVVITAGVRNVRYGLILGPALWNSMYGDVLKLSFLRGFRIVGFVDDVVLLVICEFKEKLKNWSRRRDTL